MVSFRRKKADPRQGRGYRAVQSVREQYAQRVGLHANGETSTQSADGAGSGTGGSGFGGSAVDGVNSSALGGARGSEYGGESGVAGTARGTSMTGTGRGAVTSSSGRSTDTTDTSPWGAPPPRLGEVTRRRRKKWMIVIAIVMALAVLAGILVRTTPIITVSTIDVQGNEHTGTDSVIQASGISAGDNLAAVHTDRAAHSVVALPWVRQATVSRDWLHRRVTIEVKEASVSVWVDSGGDHLFDPEGEEIATVTSGTHPDTAVKWDTILPVDPVTSQAVAHIITKVQQGLPDVISQISTVHATNPHDVTIHLSDGRSVRWGTSENLDAKLEAMKVVLSRDGKAWDVSNPRQVSVTY